MPNPNTAQNQAQYEAANAVQTLQVARSELPLYCPPAKSALWNSHPRVFLPIEDAENGECRCPYCGTLYRLKD